jgi:hypothetical protein
LSISDVMISLVEKNARSTAGISASAAPPAAPAATIAGIESQPEWSPIARPAAAPRIAPAYSCPSPPMLNNCIRKAIAAHRPVKIRGVAEIRVSFSDCRPTKAESNNRRNVCTGA